MIENSWWLAGLNSGLCFQIEMFLIAAGMKRPSAWTFGVK